MWSEVADLLAKAKGTRLNELLVLLALTGCRIGEALGSHWEDFDLAAGLWRVSRTTSMSRDGRLVVKYMTKTKDSRTVHLAPEAVTALRAQRADVYGHLYDGDAVKATAAIGRALSGR